MKHLLYILILLVSMSTFGQNQGLFDQGKERYKAEKYQEAIDAWLKIVASGEHSAALYFNLGNGNYELNNIGPSIYFYEKALQLDPTDSEIRNNLRFAQNATIDVIEPLPRTVFSKWYSNVSGILTYEGWALATVIFSSSFVALFLLYYFSFSESRKRLMFVSSMFMVLFLLGSLTMAFRTYSDYTKNNPAIIFAESTEVKNGPTIGSEIAFMLHEGTKVQILERDNEWVRIRLVNGKDGWILESDIKEL